MTLLKLLQFGDVRLSVSDDQDGLPVFFQHGLGGSANQVSRFFPNVKGIRRITVDCRGHGNSSFGQVRPFSIEMFARDILTVADQFGLERFVIGGNSMGAALAFHISHYHRDRVAALIMLRPAWTFHAAPDNMLPILDIAKLIRSYTLEQATELFLQTEVAARLSKEAPDNLIDMFMYFQRPNALEFAQVLADIITDGPRVSKQSAAGLLFPTLIIGSRQDFIHPLSYAADLAAAIPGARFQEVIAKSIDEKQHVLEISGQIRNFLEDLLRKDSFTQ